MTEKFVLVKEKLEEQISDLKLKLYTKEETLKNRIKVAIIQLELLLLETKIEREKCF